MSNKRLKLSIEDGTLIGFSKSKKQIIVPDNCKHTFACGTTGSGKTVALSNFIKNAVDKNFPIVIIDGKGDIGKGSLLDIVQTLAPARKKYIINLNNPSSSDFYNPFKNTTFTVIKDMLINMTEWSEEHYKLNTERYLQRATLLLSKFNQTICFENIINCLDTNKFVKTSTELLKLNAITKAEHLKNIEIAGTSGKIAQDAIARFATIYESQIGNILDANGIDICEAMQENAIILFVLNPLMYPELSPMFGRLALIDCKKAVAKFFNNPRRTFFIFDEISSYASTSLLDLVNKSRSANISCILATQSLSDLDTVHENFKEQVIENCNNYIVLRQNSAQNAENFANILGTRNTIDVTYQLQQDGFDTSTTGLGSARRTREFLYHPDFIKTLKTGEGIFLSKDLNYHSKVAINKPI